MSELVLPDECRVALDHVEGPFSDVDGVVADPFTFLVVFDYGACERVVALG